jgi:hypothetical protein
MHLDQDVSRNRACCFDQKEERALDRAFAKYRPPFLLVFGAMSKSSSQEKTQNIDHTAAAFHPQSTSVLSLAQFKEAAQHLQNRQSFCSGRSVAGACARTRRGKGDSLRLPWKRNPPCATELGGVAAFIDRALEVGAALHAAALRPGSGGGGGVAHSAVVRGAPRQACCFRLRAGGRSCCWRGRRGRR